MRVTVYCASSQNVDHTYYRAVEQLARTLVENNVEIVYGGGGSGLMGHLADTVLALDGTISGVMPEFMKEVEFYHSHLTSVTFVADMRERKRLLLEGTDAVVALPGGCGTVEELLEAMTLKRLGRFTKPIVLVNVNNFYEPLIKLLENSIAQGFMNARHRELWTAIHDPAEVMNAISTAPEWYQNAIEFA